MKFAAMTEIQCAVCDKIVTTFVMQPLRGAEGQIQEFLAVCHDCFDWSCEY